MEIDEYQRKAWTTATSPHTDLDRNIVDRLEYEGLCLAGEVGELCNKIKKMRRDDKVILTSERLNQLIGEMGGIFWYLASLATQLEISLSIVAKENIKELSNRKKNNTILGEGDKR
jgi:NTP pyrophosphatase (non-canonical NTP hydrolase)